MAQPPALSIPKTAPNGRDIGLALGIIAILCIRGLAMAFTFIPLQAAAFATISPASTGRASSLFNTDRQVGSSMKPIVLATAFAVHAGIALCLGMITFGMVMIIGNCAFLDPAFVEGVAWRLPAHHRHQEGLSLLR